ncbi:conserved hypothetical protein [Coccidioides posadasii str. Silveira]|uniref:Uncharacterized protein n=2 Tax=Coccidioides posadasii TaxID=199306 RepID=E9DI73_COCPS|nr:conserved hypothetical protein [Coccidioides posadasii str. Silveira]KMM67909.1 hypothetical protein CPAG_04242 [Coccidioides posadasii RMSCC 3488]
MGSFVESPCIYGTVGCRIRPKQAPLSRSVPIFGQQPAPLHTSLPNLRSVDDMQAGTFEVRRRSEGNVPEIWQVFKDRLVTSMHLIHSESSNIDWTSVVQSRRPNVRDPPTILAVQTLR